jgi:glycerol-3-phosphate cytidylyltransferase
MENKNIIVLTYGTFDMFHVGHLNLLRRLRGFGTQLIVGVSTDEFNAVKGKKTVIPYADRAAIVAGIRYVDSVFQESSWSQKRHDIQRLNVDIFAMGGDWEGKFDDLRDVCQVAYVPRTEGVSTTEIKAWARQQPYQQVPMPPEQQPRGLSTIVTPGENPSSEQKLVFCR